MEPNKTAALNSKSATARSAEEYLAWIPRRLAALIAGREPEVAAALAAADVARLEKVASDANAIAIEGRRISAEEVEISPAPTVADLLGGPASPAREAARREAREDLLAGRVAAQLFFAGAATRFKKAAGGPLYFFEVWNTAELVLGASGAEVPAFAGGMTVPDFKSLRDAVGAAAAAIPAPRRLKIALGPRILLTLRAALDRIAREGGEEPGRVRARMRFIVHVPDSAEGRKILSDLSEKRFLGFDPRNFLVIVQPLFAGWTVSGGSVIPLAESEGFPYGHGYSTMQLVQPGAGALWSDGGWKRVPEEPLDHLRRDGDLLIRTHRVNDLSQLSPAILDLDRLAAGRLLIHRGHSGVIELVENRTGQKGGNWITLHGGDHRFLIEGMNAKAGGWPAFLEQHRNAPYNAFRNMYHAGSLRDVLHRHALPGHLRIRSLPGPAGQPRAGLYLESVTGDLTQIPEVRAAAFRLDDREEIHDLKELRDLPEGVQFVAREDQDEDFRRAAAEAGA